jgi:hypothetical protein
MATYDAAVTRPLESQEDLIDHPIADAVADVYDRVPV